MKPDLPFIRRLAKRWPAATVVVSVALFIASLVVIGRARFDTDVTRLIPSHAEKTALYFEVMEKTGGLEKAYLLFSSDRAIERMDAIDGVGREIAATGLATKVEWKISDEAKAFIRDVYAKKAPLLLDEDEMKEFLRRLTPEGIKAELGRSLRKLALAGGTAELVAADPLNLFELFLGHAPLGHDAVDLRSGYFLGPDGRQAVMIITPAGSARDISFSRRFVEETEKVISRYRTQGLSIELTGNHAITLHEATVMKRELLMNILMSFASVMAFFLVFFRSLKGLLFVLIPTVMSMAITAAAVLLFTGTLSEVSGGFSALIAGLGVDLGIVLYARYLIDLQSGQGTEAVMDASISMVHRGITTGLLTSAITFLPMLLSSFRGVRELGLLTGLALLVCWALLFGLVPLILKPSRGKAVHIALVEKVTVFSHERPAAVFSLVFVLSVVSALLVPRIEVVGDIARLGTPDNPARASLERLKNVYGRDAAVFIKGSGPDLDGALEASQRLKAESEGLMTNVKAASDFLPPSAIQKRNLAALATIDPARVVSDFRREAGRLGFRSAMFDRFLGGLRSMLENRGLLTIEELGPMRSGLDRLLVREKNGWTVFVTGTPKDAAVAEKLLPASATGPLLVRSELLRVLGRDTILISIAGLLLVNIVLYLDFRNIAETVFCQVPVFLSILWTLGVMAAGRISLNFMNAFVFVMLFGIGTDYAVHLLHRYRKDRDVKGTFSQTGTAITISGLTTVAGVGSIGATSYQGLASMGQVTAIGTFFCVLLSLTLVPALMRLRPSGDREQGGPDES